MRQVHFCSFLFQTYNHSITVTQAFPVKNTFNLESFFSGIQTRIDHNRIRRINGQRILFQMFESYVLRINIIYNTLHILRHIQSHVSYIHSHKFGFLKLLRKLIQRIVQKDFQRVPHNGHFQIVIYLLRARKQILPFF